MKRFFFFLVIVILMQLGANCQNSERVRVLRGCGITKDISPDILLECIPSSPKYYDLVRSILFSSGQKNLPVYIASTKDPNIEYAISGRRKDGMPCIILNEADLNSPGYDLYVLFAFLAHEVGHINNGNFNTDTPLTKQFELDADYYSGFWSAKDTRTQTKLQQILEAFSGLSENETHPPFDPDRKNSIEKGWDDGNIPFTIAPTFAGKTLDSIYGPYLNALVTVTPGFQKKWWFKKSGIKHNVFISIQSNDKKLSNDALYSKIQYVSYVFHPPTFRQSDVIFTQYESKNGFEEGVTVWGEFPITIIVTFKDDTVFPFTKLFKFPEKNTESY